jgi:ketosteroid isomerase-like protein
MMIIFAAAAAANPQCKGVPITSAVANYATLIRKQDSPSIAHLFGKDGVIDNPGAAPIRGETAILTMLSSFKGAVVKSEDLTIADLEAQADNWRVTGRFHQSGLTPAGKDYDVTGSFDSTWACAPEGWRVRRMATGK